MKKVSVITLVLFVLAISLATAQAVIPRIGMTRTTVDLSDELSGGSTLEVRYGLIAGLGVELPVSKILYVQPELVFHQKGWKEKYSDVNVTGERTYGLNYLELPVLFKLKFGKFFVSAGPFAAIGIRGRYKFTEINQGQKVVGHKPIRFANNTTGTQDIVYLDNPFDAGVQGGLGVKVFNRIYLELRYSQSFINIFEEQTGLNNNRSRNNGFQFTVGFPSPRD